MKYNMAVIASTIVSIVCVVSACYVAANKVDGWSLFLVLAYFAITCSPKDESNDDESLK